MYMSGHFRQWLKLLDVRIGDVKSVFFSTSPKLRKTVENGLWYAKLTFRLFNQTRCEKAIQCTRQFGGIQHVSIDPIVNVNDIRQLIRASSSPVHGEEDNRVVVFELLRCHVREDLDNVDQPDSLVRAARFSIARRT